MSRASWPRVDPGARVRLEFPMGVPPRRLGLVERDVGALEQFVGVVVLRCRDGQADADADRDASPVEVEGWLTAAISRSARCPASPGASR